MSVNGNICASLEPQSIWIALPHHIYLFLVGKWIMAIACVVLYPLLFYKIGASVISETLFITSNCCVAINTSLTQNIRLCLADFLFIFPVLMVYKVIVSTILYKLLFYHSEQLCDTLRKSV